jgi:septin family protein
MEEPNWNYNWLAGESGLGKSTLVNSLFMSDLYADRKVPDAKGNSQNGNGTGESTFGKLGGVAAKIIDQEHNINQNRGLLGVRDRAPLGKQLCVIYKN